MGSKYVKNQPETYRAGKIISVKGGKRGPRTDDDRRALICPQAQSVVAKFGGPYELARTLKECSDDPEDHYSPSTIYRWMYPKEAGGTGGEIPTRGIQAVMKVARLAGVMLTTEDIYPHIFREESK